MMLRRALIRQRPSIRVPFLPSARTGEGRLPSNQSPILYLASIITADGNDDNPTNLPFQVRWKRNDGHSSFLQPRKSTKKQKKEYRKRQREIFDDRVGKHSAPGSKASIRRQFDEETRQDLLNRNKPDESTGDLEYDYGDALLDDLMGNTAALTSTPTPQPVYLGDKHKLYYNRVADQMARYKHAMKDIEEGETTAVISMVGLPGDHDISMLVRSYRDRHGSRLKPVGVAKVLEHLLKDLQIPISTFGEETFTSILTCCTTSKEARRMFRLMQDLSHPISSYSWSILVDIHSKLGDFKGADEVLREMVIEGVTPTLPAYTSLLAACYKVANAGHIPSSVRTQAGKLGWSKWKEMRIIGVEPDAMAYGAMLRLCAARGQAEKALNILDEMPTFGVKPTTLCFSSALKAVARSHQIAIRFENGSSKMFRKRQEVASYHGKMARQIVILAEGAEVEQDDGFIAALILCAGASGDSATAKAILLASEIRNMDHLRTIGSDDHLKRLHTADSSGGEDSLKLDSTLSELFLNGDPNAAEAMMEESMKELAISGGNLLSTEVQTSAAAAAMSYGEREYGKDSRIVSALMQACSQAVDSKGMGTVWEGRDNKGYLCENSLRMLTIKPEPNYMDNSVPGVSSTTVGLGSLTYDEEEPEHMSKRLRRAKFMGIDMDDSGTNMDDLDPYFYQMYKSDDPLLNRANPDSVTEQLPADDPAWDLGSREVITPQTPQISTQPKEEWYFDIDQRKWKSRMSHQSIEGAAIDEQAALDSDEIFVNNFGLQEEEENEDFLEGRSQLYFDATSGRVHDEKDRMPKEASEEAKEEWYFDQDESKWKTRPFGAFDVVKMVQPALTEYEATSLTQDEEQSMISYPNSTDDYRDTGGVLDITKPGFDEFANMLKNDIEDGSSNVDVSKAEMKELYEMMGNSSGDSQGSDLQTQFDALEASASPIEMEDSSVTRYDNSGIPQDESKMAMLDDEQQQMMKMMKAMGMDVSINDEEAHTAEDDFMEQEDTREAMAALNELAGTPSDSVQDTMDDDNLDTMQDDSLRAHDVDEEIDYMLEELQSALPGMPEQRVRRVRDAFKKTLGYPSLLTLTPLLRENMPERVTQEWLKRKNIQNAYFVVEKAKEDGLLDVHTMNGMLQVETSTGSIDRALACHEARFMQNGLEPTQYSDRLVLQMLVKNNRLSRALQFKERVEGSGRNFDVHSYGSLIDHYAKHRQVGSAIMMLKECVDVHDSPPNEYSLNVLRRLCRHQHLTEQVGLTDLAGPDPLEWLREGEAIYKRENSKTGRRGVLLPGNKSVHI